MSDYDEACFRKLNADVSGGPPPSFQADSVAQVIFIPLLLGIIGIIGEVAYATGLWLWDVIW